MVSYLKVVAGLDKGAVTAGDALNTPFALANNRDYTGDAVVEAVTTFTSGTTAVAFTPVIAGSIKLLDADGAQVDNGDATAGADGKITAGTYKSGKSATDVKKIAYRYNNIVIPQEKIPTVTMAMDGVALTAKAKRVQVYYSQMAAFTAKTDYGMDIGDILSTQAVSQLQYRHNYCTLVA